MSERRQRLARKRAALLAHSAVQRSELSQTIGEIETKLGSVDHTINTVRRYAARPLLIAGAVALLMIGPRRLLRIVGRSVVLVSAGRRVLRLMR